MKNQSKIYAEIQEWITQNKSEFALNIDSWKIEINRRGKEGGNNAFPHSAPKSTIPRSFPQAFYRPISKILNLHFHE